ncbi:putative muramidase [Sclerotinia borealis F-4128]|uniref:Putative muramidase n=1 Tax=Sclerotinia borealis (strain F-4128) TaxID=1432307 RepID=W9CW06_SCLBF|nr:putative muramidase [Sclerotinia borealis F-4128]
MFYRAFVTALAMASVSIAAPTPVAVAEAAPENFVSRAAAYTLFTGDGSNWPSSSAWTDFDTMWADNQAVMTTSCNQFGQANNSPTEIADIHNAIINTAGASGVDARLILAVVMQESGGCVRVPTSFGGVINPGLMQDHNGPNSCNSHGWVQNPCPAVIITGMIEDGTMGTASGDGLRQCIWQSGEGDARAAYVASRIYNTGSYMRGTDLGAPQWGTGCYASDIANRLLGWAAPATPCTLGKPWH